MRNYFGVGGKRGRMGNTNIMSGFNDAALIDGGWV